jgi:hypothetical protein
MVAYHRLITTMYDNKEIRNVIPLVHYCTINEQSYIMMRNIDPDAVTFDMFTCTGKYTNDEFMQYYAQLLYTLIVFGKNEFNHNNLRLQNIVMDEYYSEKDISEHRFCEYECRNVGLKNIVFYTRTALIPRIFNFGKASWSNAPNRGLSDNGECGMSSTFRYKSDILRLMCFVNKRLIYRITKHKSASAKLRLSELLELVSRLTLPKHKSPADFAKFTKGGKGCCYQRRFFSR